MRRSMRVGSGCAQGGSRNFRRSAGRCSEAVVRSTAEENPCQFESVHRAKRHGHDRISQPRRRERERDTDRGRDRVRGPVV